MHETQTLTPFVDALGEILHRLSGEKIVWAITGSLASALQGVPFQVNDIDLLTDEKGAYQIENLLSGYSTRKVAYCASPRIRSHFGALKINGVKAEIMGNLQKLLPDNSWEPPVDPAEHRIWIEFATQTVPVLRLEYLVQAYEVLGRLEKAKMIRSHLAKGSV